VLAAALRELHLAQGAPSTRAISTAISSDVSPISHTTVHQTLQGKVRPRWETVEKIVSYLHGDIGEFKSLWMLANRKSTFSSATSNQPGGGVLVRRAPDGSVEVADGKSPGRPALQFKSDEWSAFVAGVKSGEFDFRGENSDSAPGSK
jgi:hypothetical protein